MFLSLIYSLCPFFYSFSRFFNHPVGQAWQASWGTALGCLKSPLSWSPYLYQEISQSYKSRSLFPGDPVSPAYHGLQGRYSAGKMCLCGDCSERNTRGTERTPHTCITSHFHHLLSPPVRGLPDTWRKYCFSIYHTHD